MHGYAILIMIVFYIISINCSSVAIEPLRNPILGNRILFKYGERERMYETYSLPNTAERVKLKDEVGRIIIVMLALLIMCVHGGCIEAPF